MKIFRDKTDYDGTVVALGNFDGLHIAHMTIIRNGIKYAKENGLKSGVLLFEENTNDVVGHKIELIKAVCVGYDYSFGYKAQGDVKLLKWFGEKYGFKVFVTDVIKLDGKIVSSTYIRSIIKAGDMEKAERFLGRRYCIEGNVVKGLQNGRKMGIPTANVDYDVNMALPEEGVYAGITYVRGKRLKCVVNVGKNLTFGARKLTVESHILDFDEDIYGEYIRVSFAKKLRGVIKFDGVDKLIEQIHHDMEVTSKMDL